jgi:hypothetical protein
MFVGSPLSATASESLAVHVIDTDENFAVALVASYIVLIWRRQITLRGVAAARRAFDHLRLSRGQTKIGLLTVIRQECKLVADADVRSAFAELLKFNERNIGGAAIAYEGGGFVSAVVRSVITAINLASGSHFANTVVGSSEEAQTWLLKAMQDGSVLHGDALRNALANL